MEYLLQNYPNEIIYATGLLLLVVMARIWKLEESTREDRKWLKNNRK